MSRSLFLGDSHTCGFVATPGKVGPGSYKTWQDNNYAYIYSQLQNTPSVIYAISGAANRQYINWLKSMFEKYNDITEVFILLAPLNRFLIACSPDFGKTIVPVNHFQMDVSSAYKNVDVYVDGMLNNDSFQLVNKPTAEDYSNFPGIEFHPNHGLTNPDLRKHSYMEVKLFFEMNTHLEQQEYFQGIYAWDNICADNGAKLYLFNMTNRASLPKYNEYYGKLKTTKISPTSVEEFFLQRFIDHKKYFLDDNEHYNTNFHSLIAEQFIPWMKNL